MLIENQFVIGTVAVMATGALVAALHRIPAQVFRAVRDRLIFTIEIDNSDRSFIWVQAFIGSMSKCRYLSAAVMPPPAFQMQPPPANNLESPNFFLAPRGTCTFKWKGKRFLAWITKDKLDHSLDWRQTITLQCWRGNREMFLEMLDAARDFAVSQHEQKLEVWVPSGNDWSLADRKSLRNRDSLLLAGDGFQNLLADAQEFKDSEAWYARMGIPWRRGYLLHGPPGNGKSSFAHVLASAIKTNINVINLSTFYDDSQLIGCLSRIPRGHILLIEDVDAAFGGRVAKNGLKVTFAALLNALDGITAQDGRILILTTNHMAALDPALIRPGRSDVHILFDNADATQAAEMFRRFFPNEPFERSHRFGAIAAGCSMAQIQEHLMRHRNDANAAISSTIAGTEPMKIEATA